MGSGNNGDPSFLELHPVGPAGETETITGSALSEQINQFQLVVRHGPDSGKSHLESRGRTVVGTHKTANMRLSDPTVSRFHCVIEIDGERALIRDLGSRNGTHVDGVRVEAATLHTGATIKAGKSVLSFELGPRSSPLELSHETSFGKLIGDSPAMRRTFALLERVAADDGVTVLLTGESGAGKELAAEAIHERSARRDMPFVVVDCAAMSASLLESELFGHVRGAFTGADRDRIGAFEVADGGTLFLDEIGELELELQPVLLRALESRSIQRVGTSRMLDVDVRIIAATHRPLERMVNDKTFRSDLYYRLAVIPIEIPPLRRRRDDIPLLVDAIAAECGIRDQVREFLGGDPARIERLKNHDWPGNVRELRNFLLQCRIQGEVQQTRISQQSPPVDLDVPFRRLKEAWVRDCEREYARQLYEACDGNVSAMAKRSGLTRASIYRLLRDTGLK